MHAVAHLISRKHIPHELLPRLFIHIIQSSSISVACALRLNSLTPSSAPRSLFLSRFPTYCFFHCLPVCLQGISIMGDYESLRQEGELLEKKIISARKAGADTTLKMAASGVAPLRES